MLREVVAWMCVVRERGTILFFQEEYPNVELYGEWKVFDLQLYFLDYSLIISQKYSSRWTKRIHVNTHPYKDHSEQQKGSWTILPFPRSARRWWRLDSYQSHFLKWLQSPSYWFSQYRLQGWVASIQNCAWKHAEDKENVIRESANLVAYSLPIHLWYLFMYSLSTPSSSRFSLTMNFPGIKMLSRPWTWANLYPRLISAVPPIEVTGLNRKYVFSLIFDPWVLDWHIYPTGGSLSRIQPQLQEFEENVRTSANKVRKT